MEGLTATARNLEQTEQLLHKECKRTDADASELLASLALSLAVVRANPKFAPTDAEHLSATVERYKTAVTRAITNNDVKRVVTQTRLVASIEATNFRLLSLVQPHAIAMGVPFAAHQTALAPERDAREWWTAHFATYPLQVPWELFLSAFSSYLSSLTPQQLLFTSDVTFLRYLLDVNSTGHVGLWKYAELIRLLGHPPQLLGKLRELAAAKWFHGFASSSEAEKMLALAAPGTFLLRFSKAKASAVAIAFKESTTAYKHTVIATSAGKYVIDGQKYRSLSHLVLAYAHLLSTPLEHSLLRDASFFGDISGSEAQELMAGRRLGEYLWRFSSRARFLSLTFVAAEAPTQVRHVLIEELLGGGYRVETDSTVHASLAAVVAALTALPIRAAMQHSVWTQPLPPYGAAAASPYEVLVPPAPSPFRNLTDFRAGSYRDLDGDNAGAQPFAPPAAPRVPSPVPDADAVRRTNYAPAPATTAVRWGRRRACRTRGGLSCRSCAPTPRPPSRCPRRRPPRASRRCPPPSQAAWPAAARPTSATSRTGTCSCCPSRSRRRCRPTRAGPTTRPPAPPSAARSRRASPPPGPPTSTTSRSCRPPPPPSPCPRSTPASSPPPPPIAAAAAAAVWAPAAAAAAVVACRARPPRAGRAPRRATRRASARRCAGGRTRARRARPCRTARRAW